jgi:hypothetical protein
MEGSAKKLILTYTGECFCKNGAYLYWGKHERGTVGRVVDDEIVSLCTCPPRCPICDKVLFNDRDIISVLLSRNMMLEGKLSYTAAISGMVRWKLFFEEEEE